MLDIATIRARFPALQRVEAGQPAAYFDGPGGTQVVRSVVDAMEDYLLHHNANTHWAYATSAETDALIAGARETLADFLGCAPAEVAFGANMTTLTFHFTRALGRDMGPGDEVVVTRLDHQANVGPWQALARERGIRVREVPFRAEDGTLELDALRQAVGERTRWVAVGAASNALGTITPMAQLHEIARAAGARLFVDAVHYAPHELVDVDALGADALACSPYKFYGPHMGVLFVREDLQRSLDVPRLAPAGDQPPEVLETGTLSHEGMVGSAAAVDFFASLGTGGNRRARLVSAFSALRARGEVLLARLWNGLESLDGVTLYGPRPGTPRTPTVAFTVAGHPAERVTAHLSDRHGIFTSHGDFYASTVVEDLGLAPHGLVRAGCACYTTEEEVDRLIAGVAELL
ncbi:MAG: cysteine desulfurase-like protein [Gemmatimonadales bacterium]|nr:MAG: cysteine desulfurase-like protein [Gemmatimonadales bacterium]